MAEKRVALEWSVENFSCYHVEVHGTKIGCPNGHSKENSVWLCPKGENGRDENLIVRIRNGVFWGECCEVHFHSSDGILISRNFVRLQEMEQYNLHVLEKDAIVEGPKFEEVIRKNESLQKDVITIRILAEGYEPSIADFQIRRASALRNAQYSGSIRLPETLPKDNNNVSIVRTVIDTFDSYLKYSIGTFKCTSEWQLISRIEYQTGDYCEGLDLFASKEQCMSGQMDCIIRFKVNSRFTYRDLTPVKICISTIVDNDRVIKHEETEHLFPRNHEFHSFKPLPIDRGQDYQVLITLKIVGGKLHNYVHSSSRSLGNFEMAWKNPCVSDQNIEQTDNSMNVLSKDLMCLYQDQDFSDFQLKCDNVTFPVHKVILSARSPVFKTMLSTDMAEAASSEVDIGDLDPSTLSRFLTYLYTGVVEDLQGESALKLYYAADKYEVPALKRECADFLCSNVSMDNVCDILSFADRHEDDQLTSVAHKFILENFNDVLKSKEWESLMKHEPFLAAKTVTRFAQSDYVGKIHQGRAPSTSTTRQTNTMSPTSTSTTPPFQTCATSDEARDIHANSIVPGRFPVMNLPEWQRL